MNEASAQAIDKALELMREHFDAVQILATFQENGSTDTGYVGFGNWYARQGMAHEFINKDIAQENARQFADKLNPEL